MSVTIVEAREGEKVDLDEKIPPGARVGDYFLMVARDAKGAAAACVLVGLAAPQKHTLKRMVAVPVQYPIVDALGSLYVDLLARVERLESSTPRAATAVDTGAPWLNREARAAAATIPPTDEEPLA
jgi:hypothetical protein